jgi:predicted nucleotidyltransferase
MAIRDVYPTKYYSEEGFVERKLEINEAELHEIIEEYLMRNADFDFDEVEIINNRPMNIWLYAKCRKYIDPDNPEEDEALNEAEVEITGDYDGNPT